jgi:probable rRNA maturation factor
MAPDEDGRRRLSVLVADERGHRVRAGALASWLRRVAPAAARGMVSIALVSDTRIRALNRTYRHKDAATDVLSFGAQGRPERRRGARERSGAERFLGDIVIARGIARRQARAAGHSETTELRVLALHGLLHLLGYDHDRDAGTMRRIEQRLRRKGGLREGLIERAGPVVVATVRRRGRHALKRP